MKASSPRRRTRRLAILGALVIVAAFVAGTAYAGRTNDANDPRNFSYGLTYRGNPQTDCWKHHRPEGMADSHVVIPIFPKAIKRGEPAKLQVQVENSWKYRIAALKVKVNLSGEDTYLVPIGGSADEAPGTLQTGWNGVLGNHNLVVAPPPAPRPPGHMANHTFTVEPGAMALVANGEMYYPEGSGTAIANKAAFTFKEPGRSRANPWIDDGKQGLDTDPTRRLTLPSGDIGVTPGEWTLSVDYANGDAPEVSYSINVTVVYRAASQNEFVVHEEFRNPPNPPADPAILIPPRGVSDVIEIPILGILDGTQHVEVNVTALLFYHHQAGGTPNEDSFSRYASQDIVVGDAFIASDQSIATAGTVTVDLYMMSGEVTGFAAAFLLLPSLLLGGTYGRASRKFLNDVLGGAKRRVMFHNLVSLGLTLVALVHIVFFLLEVRYTVLMGVLFGGLGALCLLILGLTGYYQVPLIQKYGYNWWRYIHLVVGLLVVVFVAYHAIADGPDFFFIKEQLPKWLNDANLAQK